MTTPCEKYPPRNKKRADGVSSARSRCWWSGGDLNPRHADFQSTALPTELPDQQALDASRYSTWTAGCGQPLSMVSSQTGAAPALRPAMQHHQADLRNAAFRAPRNANRNRSHETVRPTWKPALTGARPQPQSLIQQYVLEALRRPTTRRERPPPCACSPQDQRRGRPLRSQRRTAARARPWAAPNAPGRAGCSRQ